jgi:hypothetical protein
VHHVAATPKDAACMGIRSGVDMQFYDFAHDIFQKALIDCVQEHTLPVADLDRAVRSVLRVKFQLGLLDHPFVDANRSDTVYRSQQHLAVSLRSARESMTLLKNDRFAEGACANQDIDIGVPVEESKRFPAFQDAVALGFDDFTFLLKGNPLSMDKVDVVGLELAIRYRPRTSQTIEVDLGPPGIQRRLRRRLVGVCGFKAGVEGADAA